MEHEETQEARRKRLGVLIRNLRRPTFKNADDLAEVAGVGRTTMYEIERGKKRFSESIYNQIELALHIPLGRMQRVLSGELKTLTDNPAEQAETESYVHGEQVYTKDQLRLLARELGPQGFIDWVNRANPRGGHPANPSGGENAASG